MKERIKKIVQEWALKLAQKKPGSPQAEEAKTLADHLSEEIPGTINRLLELVAEVFGAK